MGLSAEKATTNKGAADFLIKVMYRKNYTWQGEVHWLDADRKMRFRSYLELFMLLQEAMELSGSPSPEYHIRSWKRKNVNN